MHRKNLILIILFFGIFFALTSSAQAANHYIRDGASGDGSNWTNALDDLPITFARGDTYYIAAGNYGEHTFGPTTGDASQYVTIKKATNADYGNGDNWQNEYGDGQAVFAPSLIFLTSNWIFDGMGGSGSNFSGYGFKITPTNCDQHNYLISAPPVGQSALSLSNITISHAALMNCGEEFGLNTVTGLANRQLGIYGNALVGKTNNYNISHNYFDKSSVNIGMWGWRNAVIEHNYFNSNWSASYSHGEQFSPGDCDDITVQYNVFKNSTPYIIGAHVTGCGETTEYFTTHPDEQGVVSEIISNNEANNSLIKVAGATWTVNEFVTRHFRIYPNADFSSAIYAYKIISNTSDTVTVIPAVSDADRAKITSQAYFRILNCMGPNENWKIHGNVAIGSGRNDPDNNDGSGYSQADSGYAGAIYSWKIYNNTFYNFLFSGFGPSFTGRMSDASKQSLFTNNLFYNCGRSNATALNSLDYSSNAYFNSTGYSPGEENIQIDSENPFIDIQSENFALKAGTVAGKNNLGSPFDIDISGNIRGADGTWDRGAYEYTDVQTCTTKGDFTCNGYNLSDIQTMISIILGTDTITSRTQADMTTPPDGVVDIGDLQLLINKVLGIN